MPHLAPQRFVRTKRGNVGQLKQENLRARNEGPKEFVLLNNESYRKFAIGSEHLITHGLETFSLFSQLPLGSRTTLLQSKPSTIPHWTAENISLGPTCQFAEAWKYAGAGSLASQVAVP
jgi:hypothetical protein